MKITRRGVLWAAGALLGIAVTAALTWSVSQLSGQRIGLSSQPLSVIRGLAPPPTDDGGAGLLSGGARSGEAPGATRREAAKPAPRQTAPVRPAPAASRTSRAPAASASVTASGSGTSSAGSSPRPAGHQSDDAGQSGQGGSQSGAATSGRDD